MNDRTKQRQGSPLWSLRVQLWPEGPSSSSRDPCSLPLMLPLTMVPYSQTSHILLGGPGATEPLRMEATMHAGYPDLVSERRPLASTFHVALPVWMDWDTFACYSFLSTPGSDAFSSGSVVPFSGWSRAEGARTQAAPVVTSMVL